MPKIDSNLENLTQVINEHTATMSRSTDPADYNVKVEQLTKLIGAKDTLANAKSKARFISGDALVNGIASLAGVAMIVNFEKAAVLTSKAVQFVSKLR